MTASARTTLTLGVIAMLAAAQDAAEKGEDLTLDPLPLKRATAREFNRQFVAADVIRRFARTPSANPCGAQTPEQAERAKRLAEERRKRKAARR